MSSDVLSQSEVEALLAALDPEVAARGKEAAANAAPARNLANAPLPADVALYDFKRPERVSKDQMRALQAVHESFGRNLGATLSGYLRTIIDVKLVSIDQLTYSEFIFSLDNPTCFGVVSCSPLEGFIVLEMNPTVVYPIIDRLLGGGKGKTVVPKRGMTEIEMRLVNGVNRRALEGLKTAWANIADINFAVDRIESNPQLVYIVPPNEVVVLISFEIAMGDVRGMMNLCMPFNVIEPVIGSLSTNTWFVSGKKEPVQSKAVVQGISNATVQLVTYLGETLLTAKDIRDLKLGDIITIEKDVRSPLLLEIEGKPKFRVEMFSHKNRKVVQVKTKAEQNARING